MILEIEWQNVYELFFRKQVDKFYNIDGETLRSFIFTVSTVFLLRYVTLNRLLKNNEY